MSSLGLVFKLLAVPVSPSLCRPRASLRSLSFPFRSFISTRTTLRPYSIMAQSRDDLFNYTSGRWIFNDDIRHVERKLVFKVDELSRLAAEAVNRSPDDIVDLKKIAEGGFNRIFLITMRCGFQMVARIPYPVTSPKYFAVASEVATMAFLRSLGLPLPQIYGYSPTPNNAAGNEYIFMEFVQGINLSDIWSNLEEGEINSITHQLAQLESKIMSIVLPAGGSLYFTEDLENAPRSASWHIRPGRTTLANKDFCVGPDTSLPLWYGRRSQLDLDRGPYESVEAAFIKGAEKELAFLQRFGRPSLPFQRVRREAYKYQEQPPSAHIENLNRYLLIAPSLISSNSTLRHFCIRHPDLQPGNIIVSGSNLHVVGLIDWQHTSILPLFLHASIPQLFQNCNDPISQSMTRPSLPETMDDMDVIQQSREIARYRRRLLQYHYVKNTKELNELHYAALMDPMNVLRRRLFRYASDPWQGETLALKVALIEATDKWKTLMGEDLRCPIVFDPGDAHETMKLDAEQKEADEALEACRDVIGFHGPEGWVPAEYYEEAMTRSRKIREDGLPAAESEVERVQVAAHWPFDDMDEAAYM
ncbi:protein kinase subdomain-containing protein PKL/CAK/Fmp29 [Mucidula mucida]|nr:protein kinase subdomain-containing protein PKL/CAK/Fmp29 [Mucidula mucida]